VHALLRPVCWILGHAVETRLTIRGPVLRCRRCGAVLGSPQRSAGPLDRR